MAFELIIRGITKGEMNSLALKYGRKIAKKNSNIEKVMIEFYLEFIYIYFNNSRRKLKKLFLPVILSNLLENGSINSAIQEYRVKKNLFSHSYTMRILNQLSKKDGLSLNQLFRRVLWKIMKRRRLCNKGYIIGIDITVKPFYGNKSLGMARGCKNKAGTNQGLHYLTASIVEEGVRFNLICIPIPGMCNINRRVEDLINEIKGYVNIALILLDRAFGNSIYSMIFNKTGHKFCTPFAKNEKLSEFVLSIKSQYSCKEGEYNLFVLDYVFYENKPSEYQEKTRLIVLYEDDEVFFFMTNIKGISLTNYYNLVLAYRYRWGIETNYRVDNIFSPMTCSIKAQIRYLLMQVSLIIEDLWTCINYIRHDKRKKQPRESMKGDYKLVSIIKSRVKDLGFIWRPTITAVQFKRRMERILT